MEDGNQPEQIKTKDKNNTSLFSLYALAMCIANSLDSFQRLTDSCVLSLWSSYSNTIRRYRRHLHFCKTFGV